MDNCQNCNHDHDDAKKPEEVVTEVSEETSTPVVEASEGAQAPTEEVSEKVSE